MTTDVIINGEALRELRNDFTFFVAMSMLKFMAMSVENPKQFIQDMIWKWREMQINALGLAVSEREKKMFSSEAFNNVFGEIMKEVNKAQREVLVSSIRTFCDSIEKLLVTSIDNQDQEKDNEDFTV